MGGGVRGKGGTSVARRANGPACSCDWAQRATVCPTPPTRGQVLKGSAARVLPLPPKVLSNYLSEKNQNSQDAAIDQFAASLIDPGMIKNQNKVRPRRSQRAVCVSVPAPPALASTDMLLRTILLTTVKRHGRAGGPLLGGVLAVRRAADLRSQRPVLQRAAQGVCILEKTKGRVIMQRVSLQNWGADHTARAPRWRVGASRAPVRDAPGSCRACVPTAESTRVASVPQ